MIFITFRYHCINQIKPERHRRKGLHVFTYPPASFNKWKRSRYMLLRHCFIIMQGEKKHPFSNFFLLTSDIFAVWVFFLKKNIPKNKQKITPHQQDKKYATLGFPPHKLHTPLPAATKQSLHLQRSKVSFTNFLQNNSPYLGKFWQDMHCHGGTSNPKRVLCTSSEGNQKQLVLKAEASNSAYQFGVVDNLICTKQH